MAQSKKPRSKTINGIPRKLVVQLRKASKAAGIPKKIDVSNIGKPSPRAKMKKAIQKAHRKQTKAATARGKKKKA